VTTVEYEVTVSDIVDFTWHLLRRNPALRRGYELGFLGGPALGLLLLLLTDGGGMWSALAKLLVPTIVFSAFYQYFYRKQVISNARASTGSSGSTGRKTLTLDSTGLTEVAEGATMSHTWSAIEDVAETGSAVYFYNTPVSAYVVPKRAFATPEAVAAFLQDVESFRGENKRG
jgi:hypothetical protein